MKNRIALGCVVLTLATGQPRVSNWATSAGDPQRSGWERTDSRFSKDTVKDMQLLWKLKVDQDPRGPRPLQAPVILGNLISYRGFKELAIVATSSDEVYAIDADLGKLFWTKHLEYASLEAKLPASSAACPGGLTSMPVMPVPAPRGPAPAARGPVAAAVAPAPLGRGRGGTNNDNRSRAKGEKPAKGKNAPAAPAPPPTPPAPPRGPFAGTGTSSVYIVSSDGRLHRINTSTGDDYTQPIQVIPSNAAAYSLNIVDNVLYVVTAHECNDAPDAVWAVDLIPEALKPVSFALNEGGPPLGGAVVGSNGTVYVQTAEKLLALNAKDLKFKNSFDVSGNPAVTPIVVSRDNHDWIVTASKDDRLYLLDSESLLPADQTPSASESITGGLASWEDADKARWIAAASRDSIRAFKIEDRDGKPALTPAWTSPAIDGAETPVIANGVVFALSPGGGHATLHALDAATGKELYSSGNMITAPASPTGISVANGRVYFATMDGTVYCLGMYLER